MEARWTKKNAQTFYGSKDHLKVHRTTKLIETAVVTAASVHDRQAADDLVRAGDAVMEGNSAYVGEPLREQMDAQGVDTVVVQKAGRGCRLNRTDQKENRAIARIRARVEHAVAVMSGQAGRIFQRYIGPARHVAAIQMMNLCYNLQRYETIRRLQIHPVVRT